MCVCVCCLLLLKSKTNRVTQTHWAGMHFMRLSDDNEQWTNQKLTTSTRPLLMTTPWSLSHTERTIITPRACCTQISITSNFARWKYLVLAYNVTVKLRFSMSCLCYEYDVRLSVDCDHTVQQKVEIEPTHQRMGRRFDYTCMPKPTRILLSWHCDTEFYWGWPVGYGKTWSLHKRNFGGNNLRVQRLACRAISASAELFLNYSND